MKFLAMSVLVAVLAGLTAGAGEPEKKKAKEPKEPEKKEAVTNETLKEKYGDPAPAEPSHEAAKGEPLSKKVKPKPAMTAEERGKRIAELKTEQDRLQRRIMSLKNPFLPKVPPTEEEKKAEEGKGADERVRMLEERLALTEAEMKKLQDKPGRTR